MVFAKTPALIFSYTKFFMIFQMCILINCCFYLLNQQSTYNKFIILMGADDMAEFGELLLELRQEKKMTQHALAELLDVTTGTVSNYENGVNYPNVPKLLTIANLFHVSTDYLLGRCKHDVSPDVFDEDIATDKTVGEFLQELRQLPKDRREALVLIMDDLGLCAKINRHK